MSYDTKQSGERIRQLRSKNGYTQDKLAQILAIDRSLLSYIETGRRECSVDLLIRISECFEVSLDYIVFGVTSDSVNKSSVQDSLKGQVESLILSLETFRELL